MLTVWNPDSCKAGDGSVLGQDFVADNVELVIS